MLCWTLLSGSIQSVRLSSVLTLERATPLLRLQAGSIIGAVSASVAYSYNYGSVFNWESAGVPNQECHNRRKVRMHVLREKRRQLLQKQVSARSDDTTLTTSLLDRESDIVRFFV